jgi:hypothetical protein
MHVIKLLGSKGYKVHEEVVTRDEVQSICDFYAEAYYKKAIELKEGLIDTYLSEFLPFY